MKNRVGPPVEGNDFIGREKELAFAWDLIEDGNSLLIAAPRRVGKTSFAKKLIDKADKEKWRILTLNLEGVKSEQALIVAFIDTLKKARWWNSISKKAEKLMKNIKLSVEIEGVTANVEWNSNKAKIFKELESLFDHNKDTLIFIDELGVFLNKYEKQDNIDGATFFLNWFRSIRQVSNSKIRWVFCSSVGVRNFTSRHEISYTINDIEPFNIKAFDEPTAIQLISKLAESKNITISDSHGKYMLQKLEWYLPYFIQLLFKEIYGLQFQKNIDIDEKLIDDAFDILSKNSYLDTWDERLKYYYEKEPTARKILNNLAKNDKALTRKHFFDLIHNTDKTVEYTTDLLGDTLRLLINDGYLFQNEDDAYKFRSPLLKNYWYNKFIK